MSSKHFKSLGRFIRLPVDMLNSDAYRSLGAQEVKLLQDLMIQFYGDNNGCLSPCHSLMKERGWAKGSLYRAFSKLVHAGFLVVTRQGMKVRGKPTLVAVTWLPINEPRRAIVYDEGIRPDKIPLGNWYKPEHLWKNQSDRKKLSSPVRSSKPQLVLHNGTARSA